MRGAERHGPGGGAGGEAGQGGRVSIFVDESTRLLVQGITGREGSFHTRQMLEYGTQVVGRGDAGQGRAEVRGQGAGLQHRRRGGSGHRRQLRRSSTCRRWRRPAPSSKRPTPASRSSSASPRASRCMHMSRVMPFVRARGVRLIGPNCPGPDHARARAKVGIIPGNICTPGRVGLVSRSGTLTYEVVNHLTRNGIGQSTCVGIGGDPIIGTDFIDCLARLPGRSRHRCDRHDGRDRRHRRAERGGVRQARAYQAGRRLHRRADRAQGAPHGPRRRHHLRLLGHGGGKARRIRGRRHRRSCAGRWMWSSCCGKAVKVQESPSPFLNSPQFGGFVARFADPRHRQARRRRRRQDREDRRPPGAGGIRAPRRPAGAADPGAGRRILRGAPGPAVL